MVPPPQEFKGLLPTDRNQSRPPPEEPSPEFLGMPVPPQCEEMVQHVLYAPQAKTTSDFAKSCRVIPDDYKRCCDWQLGFAEHEQGFLLEDSLKQNKSSADAQRESNPARVLDAYMEARDKQGQEAQQTRQNRKNYFETLKDHITNASDSMRCCCSLRSDLSH